jgi:hypothetical protein
LAVAFTTGQGGLWLLRGGVAGDRWNNPPFPRQASNWRGWPRRLDRFAAAMNVGLVLFAIGLAVLDMTFIVTQDVIDRLPPMQQVVTDGE